MAQEPDAKTAAAEIDGRNEAMRSGKLAGRLHKPFRLSSGGDGSRNVR